jgi:hypothetical protein
MRSWIVLAVALLVMTACGNGDATRPAAGSQSGGTVRGMVLEGPRCPVDSAPVDGSSSSRPGRCADRPTAARIRVTAVGSGALVTTVHSGADGHFTLDLPPGRFELQALGPAHQGEAGPPVLVHLLAGEVTDAVVRVDTGIR